MRKSTLLRMKLPEKRVHFWTLVLFFKEYSFCIKTTREKSTHLKITFNCSKSTLSVSELLGERVLFCFIHLSRKKSTLLIWKLLLKRVLFSYTCFYRRKSTLLVSKRVWIITCLWIITDGMVLLLNGFPVVLMFKKISKLYQNLSMWYDALQVIT